MRALGTIAVVLAISLCVTTPASADPRGDRIERVSVGGSDGNWDYATSQSPAISANGRFVAFASRAYDLVPGDDNGREQDIFVRDMRTGRTTMVSRTPAGSAGNGESRFPSVSADGRYVAFDSEASNLVPGDTNDTFDVFVRDVWRERTIRVDVGLGGTEADQGAGLPDISADGRHVAFDSASTNLVPGDTNGQRDIFVRDLVAGLTDRVSLTADGSQSGSYSQYSSISADGNRVAFQSSIGLVPGPPDPKLSDAIYVHDRRRTTTVKVSAGVGRPEFFINEIGEPVISDDGQVVAFTFVGSMTVGQDWVCSVWVHDLRTGRLALVTPDARPEDTTRGNWEPSLSADGRFVSFTSAHRLRPQDRNQIWDVYLRDRRTGGLRLLTGAQTSPSGSGAQTSAVSADARRVAFYADSTGLAPGGTPGFPHIYRWSDR